MPYMFIASTRFVVMSRSSTASLPWNSMPSQARPTLVRSSASCCGSTVRSTKSLTQETGIFIALRELLQEADVALVEQTDVRDAVLDHRHALDARAERETADLRGVVDDFPEVLVDRFEDRGMHHSRTEDLDPAGLFAHAAPGAPAFAGRTAHVDLHGGFRVGEVGRTEANGMVLPEQALDERLERAHEIAERDAL